MLEVGQQSREDLVSNDDECDTLKDDSSDSDSVRESNVSDVDGVTEKQSLRKSHCFSHIVMTLAACYYAMLFTNWTRGEEIDTKGDAAVWVNMASQWCCILLFWWTLLAPLVCPSRFQSLEEEDY